MAQAPAALPCALMTRHLTVMAVHAHPDDESVGTGGTLARYATEGARVVVVTCTGGEHGEIVVPAMDTPDNHARLGEIRAAELARALAVLGVREHAFLGYRDSGMMGRPENDGPDSFWRADPDEAAGRLVRLVRRFRPQVLVGYNAFGGYGHPDHIAAHRVAVAAFERAGDPASYPEQLEGADALEPWAPAKLYEQAFTLRGRERIIARLLERGARPWWVGPEDETPEQRAEREAWLAEMERHVGPITTLVDVRDFLATKERALAEHVTQIGPGHPLRALSLDEWREHAPAEEFTLRESRVGVRLPEDDLFAGLR